MTRLPSQNFTLLKRSASRVQPRLFRQSFRALIASVVAMITAGCSSTGVPQGITPVTNFNLERYLGTWYEIARLDHKFERGLQQVTATYTQQQDGSVEVQNKGYSEKKKKWNAATGKARFVENSDSGHLKVSFFGPFYGSYIVFELDQDNYQYAMVSGPDRSYLWLLARTPQIDEELYDSLIAKAVRHGFDVSELIKVEQGG